MKQVSVLFVCMGNICRSPTAQGVFESLVQRSGLAEVIRIDSAGTHAYHIGHQPDSRSQQAALGRGVDLSKQRARQVQTTDFSDFDYFLAMDLHNLQALQRFAQAQQAKNLQLFMEFASRWREREVPDPYYGGSQGFERVLDMIEDASEGLLEHLIRTHQLERPVN
ncbi:low molecular weight protein-tyrosine-phosphatase [uncultured Thiothrix sp.]|jgi:protein-tyrosine phosphatase|uniref:low molecular weight protein-tyrosine-phosphatase n=1 Tax=uncultured Thiothrix sp. TaxID=223185 RepID=UPI00260976E8|nr:low molecular weight protein-tyrosine-phosphatase [uncultured Thiothrix sp.]HMT92302.1 low molecular weight protein-tyrosine-phosphatase [Thiolinea sp.]